MPQFLTVGQIQASQSALRPKCENLAIADGRGSTWPVVKTEIVNIMGRIGRPPLGFARSQIDGFHNLGVTFTGMKDEAALRDNRTAKAMPHLTCPDFCRTRSNDISIDAIGRGPVPMRSEQLRPVFSCERKSRENHQQAAAAKKKHGTHAPQLLSDSHQGKKGLEPHFRGSRPSV